MKAEKAVQIAEKEERKEEKKGEDEKKEQQQGDRTEEEEQVTEIMKVKCFGNEMPELLERKKRKRSGIMRKRRKTLKGGALRQHC